MSIYGLHDQITYCLVSSQPFSVTCRETQRQEDSHVMASCVCSWVASKSTENCSSVMVVLAQITAAQPLSGKAAVGAISLCSVIVWTLTHTSG